MSVVFRVDSSVTMGSGHVMRCLALAEKLKGDGALVFFVSRELPGNMADFIERQGFSVLRLPPPGQSVFSRNEDDVAHAEWLGIPWQQDAKETRSLLESHSEAIDWLIVDHYALDRRWEEQVRPVVRRIMVIDDLADRRHDSEVLLDQNLIAGMESRYACLVPKSCRCLLGPRYTLLRPEFSALRDAALARRGEVVKVERLLVTMGGMDPDNVTCMVLEGIEKASFAGRVDVVMGQNAPCLEEVRKKAEIMSCPVHVHVATKDMAGLMVAADLAVGAGGGTSWERCALGLPSLVVTTAMNQEPIAAGLQDSGAARWVGPCQQIDSDLFADELKRMLSDLDSLKKMAQAASRVCDGQGVKYVLGELVN